MFNTFLHKMAFLPWQLLAVALLFSLELSASKTQKFFVVIHENANPQDVLSQPFYTKLAKDGTRFTNYFGITHPSQPNYFALAAGSTFNQFTDSPVNIPATVETIVDLLEAKGVTWKLYIENWPGNCFLPQYSDVYVCPGTCVPCQSALGGPIAGSYARQHNPLISFESVSLNPARCAKIVDAAEFFNDVVQGTVPEFAFYIPNPMNDAHDSAFFVPEFAYSDRMLNYTFSLALSDKCFRRDRVFVLVFDESFIDQPNDTYCVFVGENVKRNHKVETEYNHYNLLRTIEDNFKVGTLGQNDATAAPMVGWRK